MTKEEATIELDYLSSQMNGDTLFFRECYPTLLSVAILEGYQIRCKKYITTFAPESFVRETSGGIGAGQGWRGFGYGVGYTQGQGVGGNFGDNNRDGYKISLPVIYNEDFENYYIGVL